MSDLTREDVIDILQGIFEEQRDMTDAERQAYYDMLRRKENDMRICKPVGTKLYYCKVCKRFIWVQPMTVIRCPICGNEVE